MKCEKWLYVEQLGQLYTEVVLVTFNIPELFVCVDDVGNRYLTVLLDEDDESYLMTKIADKDLLAMLEGKIAIEQAFRSAVGGIVYYLAFDEDECKHVCQIDKITKVPESDLPDVGIEFNLKNPKIDQYIAQLQAAEIRRLIGLQYSDILSYTARDMSALNREKVDLQMIGYKTSPIRVKVGRKKYEKKQISVCVAAGTDQALVSA